MSTIATDSDARARTAQPTEDESGFSSRPWLYAIAFWTLAALLAFARPTVATTAELAAAEAAATQVATTQPVVHSAR